MPGPLLIKETEERKCEWLVSEVIHREETQLEVSHRGPHLSLPCRSYSRLGSECQGSGGEPMQNWQPEMSQMTSWVFSFPLALL